MTTPVSSEFEFYGMPTPRGENPQRMSELQLCCLARDVCVGTLSTNPSPYGGNDIGTVHTSEKRLEYGRWGQSSSNPMDNQYSQRRIYLSIRVHPYTVFPVA